MELSLLTLQSLCIFGAGAVKIRVSPEEADVRLRFRSDSAGAEETEVGGVLLSGSSSEWADSAREWEAVGMDCERRECGPSMAGEVWREREWAALLHFPPRLSFDEGRVSEEVRQALLWGASAVVLLALAPEASSDAPESILHGQSPSHPIVLIRHNVTRILRFLANSTRLVVGMSRRMWPELWPWARCERKASFSAGQHWESTVCWEPQRLDGSEKAEESMGVLTISAVASLAYLLLRSCRLGGLLSSLGLHVHLKRRRRSRREAAVRKLGAEEVATPTGGSCPICLEEFRSGDILRRVPCGHGLHSECLDPWLLLADFCPLCRRRILLPS